MPSSQLSSPVEVRTSSKKRLLLTYVLWLFGGWFGLHRFYLRRWFSGLLYLGTFGFLGVGWFVDAFLIPKMIKGDQDQEESQAEDLPIPIPIDVGIMEEDEEQEHEVTPILDERGLILAPWAVESNESLFFRLQLFFGGVYFLVAPTILLAFAIMLNQRMLIAIMVGILLFSNFLEQARSALETRAEQLEKIPFMKEVKKHFYGFYQFYMEERPRGFLYYLFYFPFGLIVMMFSSRAREECKLYLRIFATVGAALIMRTLSSYEELFGSYLSIGDVFLHLFVFLFFLFFIVLLYMMPTMTVAFTYSLSGRRKTLKGLTFASLILASFVAFVGISNEKGKISIPSHSILSSKFKSKAFRKDFVSLVDMFLSYEVKSLKPTSAKWTYEYKMTSRFQSYAEVLAARDQRFAFHFFRLQPNGPNRKPWLGLFYRTSRNHMFIAFASPRGKIYRTWQHLPKWVKQTILKTEFPPFSKETKSMVPTKGQKKKKVESGLLTELVQKLVRKK